MQTVTPAIAKSMASSSWIRKMFEKGLELKKEFGEDAVCDFSLGNPDVPPPAATKSALEKISTHWFSSRSLSVQKQSWFVFPCPASPSIGKNVAGLA